MAKVTNQDKDQLQAVIGQLNTNIYDLELQIAQIQKQKSKVREKLARILRAEAQARREKLKAIIGLSKREHAQEGGYLVTEQCRDLCWAHNLSLSNQTIGQLISAGRIEGHQYKGGYFATKEAVMAFIEAETANPDSQFYEPPEEDALITAATQ